MNEIRAKLLKSGYAATHGYLGTACRPAVIILKKVVIVPSHCTDSLQAVLGQACPPGVDHIVLQQSAPSLTQYESVSSDAPLTPSLVFAVPLEVGCMLRVCGRSVFGVLHVMNCLAFYLIVINHYNEEKYCF